MIGSDTLIYVKKSSLEMATGTYIKEEGDG